MPPSTQQQINNLAAAQVQSAINNLKTEDGNTNIITKVSDSGELGVNEDTRVVDASNAPVVVGLPPAQNTKNRMFFIKKSDASGNTVTIQAKPGQSIDDNSEYVLFAKGESIAITSDGANWYVISQ